MLDVTPGSTIPTTGSVAPAFVPGPKDPQAMWIARVSGQSDIPRRALRAYVQAQAALARTTPACHLSWTTLAGVGRVESWHGQYHGDTLDAGGRETTPIIGPALDGSPGRRKISDTDHGSMDGDPVWDHALGPMQFLPGTWSIWGVRASADSKPADPQNIDDAALTAGRYLCASGGDLGTPQGWWAATFVYNNSVSYGQTVFSAANAYAVASR
jgi:membrane-bound lytic murein transglycosylase B